MASRKRSYTKNEVLTILNNSETESDSEFDLDSSTDSNESDDRTEAETDPTGSDNDSDATIIVDVVDEVTWTRHKKTCRL